MQRIRYLNTSHYASFGEEAGSDIMFLIEDYLENNGCLSVSILEDIMEEVICIETLYAFMEDYPNEDIQGDDGELHYGYTEIEESIMDDPYRDGAFIDLLTENKICLCRNDELDNSKDLSSWAISAQVEVFSIEYDRRF